MKFPTCLRSESYKVAGLCALTALAVCGCNPQQNETETTGQTTSEPESTSPAPSDSGGQAKLEAMADLSPTQGNQVKGTVTFSQVDGGVRVVADLAGLTEGEHGFHIHEKGDCSAPDGSSAGGHFNPTGAPHGAPDAAEHHLGDMGNITADASGKAHLDHVFSFLKLDGTNSIVGRGLIVHGGRDDLTSQPSGNAGPRVACGVIELKQ